MVDFADIVTHRNFMSYFALSVIPLFDLHIKAFKHMVCARILAIEINVFIATFQMVNLFAANAVDN